jgi:hypothetical protein
MHLDASRPVEESLVVIMPNLEVLMKLDRSWIFSSVLGSSRFFSLYLGACEHGVLSGKTLMVSQCTYGSAGLEPVSVLEYDIMGDICLRLMVLVGMFLLLKMNSGREEEEDEEVTQKDFKSDALALAVTII